MMERDEYMDHILKSHIENQNGSEENWTDVEFETATPEQIQQFCDDLTVYATSKGMEIETNVVGRVMQFRIDDWLNRRRSRQTFEARLRRVFAGPDDEADHESDALHGELTDPHSNVKWVRGTYEAWGKTQVSYRADWPAVDEGTLSVWCEDGEDGPWHFQWWTGDRDDETDTGKDGMSTESYGTRQEAETAMWEDIERRGGASIFQKWDGDDD